MPLKGCNEPKAMWLKQSENQILIVGEQILSFKGSSGFYRNTYMISVLVIDNLGQTLESFIH